jgi:hypothetical protein
MASPYHRLITVYGSVMLTYRGTAPGLCCGDLVLLKMLKKKYNLKYTANETTLLPVIMAENESSIKSAGSWYWVTSRKD